MSTRAFLGIGSNLGDRVSMVQMAVKLLSDTAGIRVLEVSSLYESEPVGIRPEERDPEWFVNAAVEIETELGPEALLDACLAVERQLGRHREGENPSTGFCSRPIDIDILFYGPNSYHTDRLDIPHPRLHERAFVLVPMLELAPDFIHPELKKTLHRLHFELPLPEQVVLLGTRHLLPPGF